MTETRDVQREPPAAKVEDQVTSTDEPTYDSTASQPSSQLQSSFFSALPLEIRQSIYRHLWLATGSIQHVYQSGAVTTFSFVGTDALSRFLNTTAPDSLARITKLHLTWRAPIATYMNLDSEESLAEMARWEKMWAEVALKIPRLKELRIWAYPCYARYPMPHEEWLRALHQFGNVPKFDVSFRWFQNPPTPDTGPLDFLDDAPFEYDRIPPVQDNPLHFHWRRLIGLPPDEPRHPVSRRQKKRRYLGRAL
ncbi:hypothetical protein CDEST_10214 [Colletotrichum destructivum]|uniref:F-box domain-containing protein n=1 Tax=Colletotrichum destructivum TaxID=34406 RepID=A0AAX4IQ76_9PEZI|nr:hypothetical protein CDEST_10214 [Colletotrichum destructivum]